MMMEVCYKSDQRCELAIEAYQKNLFDTLVISGGAVKNQYTESKEMAKFIQQKSSMPIICETQARNTYENLKIRLELLKTSLS